jgi:UDP-hydrolysing UDP-N-acetyl-D-glucosamine 2-epimerase
LKLDVVVTARPSWARVKSLVSNFHELSPSSEVRLLLVGPSVSKRYGDISNSLPEWLTCLKFPGLQESDDFGSVALTCLEGGNSLARYWQQNRPDAALVIADRTETLGVAVTASLMQIPLVHLQGGEISGSIDDKVRDANSKLADFHLTTNDFTAKRLSQMGEDEARIKIVGCPSVDLVSETIENPRQLSSSLDLGGVGAKFDLSQPFGIIMYHPDTLDEDQTLNWVNAIIDLVDVSNMNWFWFWPNPDHGTSAISKAIRIARENNRLRNVRYVINVEPEIFISMALKSVVLIGNSSFGIREASFIGLPVINIGHRQRGRQKSENVAEIGMVGSLKEFENLLEKQINKGRFSRSTLYGDGSAGYKSAQELLAWDPSIKFRN